MFSDLNSRDVRVTCQEIPKIKIPTLKIRQNLKLFSRIIIKNTFT